MLLGTTVFAAESDPTKTNEGALPVAAVEKVASVSFYAEELYVPDPDVAYDLGVKPAIKANSPISIMSGGVEILGTFIGYFAVTLAVAIMPFALAFAGGSMMYIIIDEMIPQTHEQKLSRSVSFATLGGFCLMLLLDSMLGNL
jgi:hypothetical protein